MSQGIVPGAPGLRVGLVRQSSPSVHLPYRQRSNETLPRTVRGDGSLLPVLPQSTVALPLTG